MQCMPLPLLLIYICGKNTVYVVELEITALKANNKITLQCARIFSSFASQLFRYR